MAEVRLNVPYVHQVRNTAPEFDGNWACGPTSTVMALAGYGVLQPRNDAYGQWGWYVSNVYDVNGVTFDRTQPDPHGRWAGGGYGACIEDEMCYGWRAVNFAKAHGVGARAVCPADYDTVVENVTSGKPVVVGTTVHGFGHVVLCVGVRDDGRLLFNDPYWRKPGQDIDVYSWGELGNCPWMMLFDRPLPAPSTHAPAPAPAVAPDPGPAANEQPCQKSASTKVGQGLLEIDQQRFVEAFVRNGGEGQLGLPAELPYTEDGLTVQKCPNGYAIVLNILFDDQSTLHSQGLSVLQPAFVLTEAAYNKWREAYSGYPGPLKSPVSDEFVNPQGKHQISFEGGYMIWDDGNLDDVQAYRWPNGFNSWKAEYYNNPGLAAIPAYIRDEPEINYEFSEKGPENGSLGVFANMFSARWTRQAAFEEGTYLFSVTCDDGFRLYVDGQSLPNNADDFWKISAAYTHNFTRKMSAGQHELKFEYFDAGGKAVAKLKWQKQ